ncbi:MAG: hypothetical protein JRJ02_14440 [Deltaproteobacteria bacterium]|nr:hypothetical protein [Deltaproteobacteria bacterium]
MARLLRMQYPGAWYHITSRGNEKKYIFQDFYLARSPNYRGITRAADPPSLFELQRTMDHRENLF